MPDDLAPRRRPRYDVGGYVVAGVVLLAAALAWAAADAARWEAMVALAVALAAATLWAYRLGGWTRREVVGLAVVLRLFFLPLPPVLSDDAYRYVWDGLLVLAGMNPYAWLPTDPSLGWLQQEPLFDALNSAGYYSVYPPVSQALFAIAALGYGLGWEVAYGLVKLAFTALEVAGLWALAQVVAPRRLLLYAWHPLALLEVAGQGHTEGALVGLLGLGFWAHRRGRPGLAATAVALAGWVKLVPLLLLPWLAWRRPPRRWGALGAVAALLLPAVPLLAPGVLANLRASLDLYVRLFEFGAGPYLLLKAVGWAWSGADPSKQLGPAMQVAFLLLVPLLYGVAARRRWPFEKLALAVLGSFLVLATTVHPWYLLGVLMLAAVQEKPSWAWIWLATWSIGTYLFYQGGPYLLFVGLAWGGWAMLGLWAHRLALLQPVQRLRGRRKARRLLPFLPSQGECRVLDLGAGEGYVGAALARQTGAPVVLADVVSLNRTALPLVLYDGRRLPFTEGHFDVTVLYYVLHHACRPEEVLCEALRVTRKRVLVVESLAEAPGQAAVLRRLDRWANRLRSGGRIDEQCLDHRGLDAWEELVSSCGGRVVRRARFGVWPHRQGLLVIEPLLHITKTASTLPGSVETT